MAYDERNEQGRGYAARHDPRLHVESYEIRLQAAVGPCSDHSHDRTGAEREERVDDGKVEPQFMPSVQDADRGVDQRVDRNGDQQRPVQTKDYGLQMPKPHGEPAAERA